MSQDIVDRFAGVPAVGALLVDLVIVPVQKAVLTFSVGSPQAGGVRMGTYDLQFNRVAWARVDLQNANPNIVNLSINDGSENIDNEEIEFLAARARIKKDEINYFNIECDYGRIDLLAVDFSCNFIFDISK